MRVGLGRYDPEQGTVEVTEAGDWALADDEVTVAVPQTDLVGWHPYAQLETRVVVGVSASGCTFEDGKLGMLVPSGRSATPVATLLPGNASAVRVLLVDEEALDTIIWAAQAAALVPRVV